MHIVVAQQEHHLIGLTIIEVDNVYETLHGCEPVDVLNLITTLLQIERNTKILCYKFW